MAEERDRRLEEKIQYMLDTQKEFKGYGLKAEVTNGKVWLWGIVDTLADSNRAEKMINQIEGVGELENDLTISTDGAITDTEVAMEVSQELQGDPRVDTENLGVDEVNRGTVYIRGNAESSEEANAAAYSASKARGVREVINEIDVSPEEFDAGELKEVFHSQVNNDEEE